MGIDIFDNSNLAGSAGAEEPANRVEAPVIPERTQNFELPISWKELEDSLNQLLPYIQSARHLERVQSDIDALVSVVDGCVKRIRNDRNAIAMGIPEAEQMAKLPQLILENMAELLSPKATQERTKAPLGMSSLHCKIKSEAASVSVKLNLGFSFSHVLPAFPLPLRLQLTADSTRESGLQLQILHLQYVLKAVSGILRKLGEDDEDGDLNLQSVVQSLNMDRLPEQLMEYSQNDLDADLIPFVFQGMDIQQSGAVLKGRAKLQSAHHYLQAPELTKELTAERAALTEAMVSQLFERDSIIADHISSNAEAQVQINDGVCEVTRAGSALKIILKNDAQSPMGVRVQFEPIGTRYISQRVQHMIESVGEYLPASVATELEKMNSLSDKLLAEKQKALIALLEPVAQTVLSLALAQMTGRQVRAVAVGRKSLYVRFGE